MKILTDARLLAALLVLPCILPACNKSDEGATDQDSEAQTTAATPGSTGPDGSTSGGGTSPGTTAEPVTTGDASTVDPTTGAHVTHGSSTGPDDTGSGGGDSAECVAYCAAIAGNCTGAETQFGSTENCLGVCAVLPPGTPGEMGGNTVGCRTYHAGAAAMDPTTHCVHAGPGGAGVCGGNCESFCTIAAAICPEAWADIGSCETACGTFAPEEKYDATDVAGNNFACRLYHLTAATGDPVTHCPHIKGDSAPCM